MSARRIALAFALALPLFSTAARAQAPDLQPETRIQRRFVEKKGRLAAYLGFAYLGRGDFYRSPGIEAAATFYFLESLGVDLRGAWFFSSATDELRDLTTRTGFVPDTRPSKASLLLGVRYTIGYAKIRVTKSLVIHFEPQVFLYGGIHVAEGPVAGTQVAPMGELGFGFLVMVTQRIQARLDAGVTLGGEQRTRYVVVAGGFPVISVGFLF